MTTTLRAKTPEDLLAAVPITLGFEPEDSIVMLTFGGATPFHARIDLPPPGDIGAQSAIVSSLLEPCRRHRVRKVVFVLYDADARRSRQLARRLGQRFERCGIRVIEVLRADAGRWYCAQGLRSGVPEHGVPYDTSGHRFRAQAILEGHVTLGSRADLATSVAADEQARAAIEAVLTSAELLSADELAGLCRLHADGGTLPDDLEAARMLLTVQVGALRDAAWMSLRRDNAGQHASLWRDLVRRAPDDLVASAAAVLGFAAWLSGDGALAWCALDRCFAATPEHSLGRLVAHLLEQAIAPSEWAAMQGSLDDDLGAAG